jgi:putative spermidine/putrescine transport system permease protein
MAARRGAEGDAVRLPDRFAVGRAGVIAFTGLAVAFLMAPLLVVVPMSFNDSSFLQFPPARLSLRWYREFFSSRVWVSATITSAKVGLLVAVASTILGTLAAVGLTRGRFPGRALVRSFVLSPLITPVIVLAVALYYLFAHLRLNGTLMGLVIGHTILALPYVVVVIGASLEMFDVSLERAAMGLGAGPVTTFWRVTLPLIRSGVIVGALFAFLTSFDEVVIAIFVSGPGTMTLPRKMWDGIRYELNPTIAAASSLLVAFSWLVMLGSELLRRRLQGPGKNLSLGVGGFRS